MSADKLAWARALDSLMKKREDRIPEGWRTSDQLAKEIGYCEEMTKIKCKLLVKEGLAEMREFRVRWGKMIRPRPHYRLVSPPESRAGASRKRG